MFGGRNDLNLACFLAAMWQQKVAKLHVWAVTVAAAAPAVPLRAGWWSLGLQYMPALWETPPTLLPLPFESVLKQAFICSGC